METFQKMPRGPRLRSTAVATVAALAWLTGCRGPGARPGLAPAPAGMPVERLWVASLPQRWQQTVWRGWLPMPDRLESQIALRDDRLLSVEAQYVEQGYSRRLRMIERDPQTGGLTREIVMAGAVPADRATCRLLEITGRWYVAHAPWAQGKTPGGMLTAWPGASGDSVVADVIRASLLPPEMASHLDDGRCFGTDGAHLLAATVVPRLAKNDTRRALTAASIDVARCGLDWAARVEIPFVLDRYRGGARIGRFGGVVLARASVVVPQGQRRCREVFAAFDPETGRQAWSRLGPARAHPPAFELVADDRCVYVHADDKVIEAWRLVDGSTAWRQDLGRTIVATGRVHQGALITFVGDGYPGPRAPTVVEPIAVDLTAPDHHIRLPGEIRAAVAPSFAVVERWVVAAPDDRLIAWPLLGATAPLEWECWQLPGGLLPEDAASRMMSINDRTLLAYMPGTGTLTLLRLSRQP